MESRGRQTMIFSYTSATKSQGVSPVAFSASPVGLNHELPRLVDDLKGRWFGLPDFHVQEDRHTSLHEHVISIDCVRMKNYSRRNASRGARASALAAAAPEVDEAAAFDTRDKIGRKGGDQPIA